MRVIDYRTYTGFGSLAGCVLGFVGWFVVSRNESDFKNCLVVCSLIGTALGAVLAWRERNTL